MHGRAGVRESGASPACTRPLRAYALITIVLSLVFDSLYRSLSLDSGLRSTSLSAIQRYPFSYRFVIFHCRMLLPARPTSRQSHQYMQNIMRGRKYTHVSKAFAPDAYDNFHAVRLIVQPP